MEIVLGVLLLFGAFTLGTVSSDPNDHDTHTAQHDSAASDHHEQSTEATLFPICPTGTARYFRDLTVPLAPPERPSPKATQENKVDDDWKE